MIHNTLRGELMSYDALSVDEYVLYSSDFQNKVKLFFDPKTPQNSVLSA